MAVILPRRALMLGFGAAGIACLPKTPWADETDRITTRPTGTLSVNGPRAPAPSQDIASGEAMPANKESNRAVPALNSGRPWSLAIIAPYAGSQENLIYRIGPYYSKQAIRRFSMLMRDWHVQEARWISPRLFDVLAWLQEASGTDEPITLTSGFRSLQTELSLFPHNLPLAYNSPHTAGLAADIRIPGVHPEWVRDAALALQVGGVGWYPTQRFVHVDTGPVRHWIG